MPFSVLRSIAMHYTADHSVTPAADALDPSRFPRTYRVSTRNRILFLLLGGVALAGGLAGMWYFGTGHETKTMTEAVALAAVSFGFVLLGGALVLYVLTTKVVLRADAIELHDFMRTRTLRRDDIAGWRVLQAQHVSVLTLESKRAGVKPLKITQILKTDALLDAWLAGLSDLDARERERSTAEIAASRDLGRTSEERLARLAVARKVANALTGIAVVVSAWGFLLPEPYELVIASLAALPLVAVALAARAGSLYQIAGHKNDARASLALVFIGPGMVLGLRAILDIELLEWGPALAATVVAAAALTLVLAATDRQMRGRRWELLAMLFLSLFYAYGGVVEANALLDRSAPQVYEAKVVDKHKSSGKTTQYYLRLTPWGPRATEEDVSVTRDLYESSSAGRTMCVVYRAGALEIPWFTVYPCRGS
ncbi:hypothetical protein SVA_0895 [Sulfurifustis variabilis]|uniref:Uncharacterized protein n=2 Tax=Sulfurifustis variabilis TaxID=1675686 RepID=A0A1B4V7W9_9GAMM|nr:hypothetical protein SVA_0895 [Sulfurifustis variabilis]